MLQVLEREHSDILLHLKALIAETIQITENFSFFIHFSLHSSAHTVANPASFSAPAVASPSPTVSVQLSTGSLASPSPASAPLLQVLVLIT